MCAWTVIFLKLLFVLLILNQNLYSVSCRRKSTSLQRNTRTNDRVVFPETSSTVKPEIPLELIQRLNEISNVSEFMENFVQQEPLSLRISALSLDAVDRGDDIFERKAVQSAKMAKCMPELQTVSLHQYENSKTFYFPSCTRVERCGGCCTHELLSCQPVESEIINFQVVATEYEGGNRLKYKGKEIVPVEQHTKCKCDCKVQPQDCKPFQKYSRAKCICECANVDEEHKCYEQASKKIWDPKNCRCVCRSEQPCTTGFYFDEFNCNCLPIRGNKRNESRKEDRNAADFFKYNTN